MELSNYFGVIGTKGEVGERLFREWNISLDLPKDSSTQVGFEAFPLWAQGFTLSLPQGTAEVAAKMEFFCVTSLSLTEQNLRQASSALWSCSAVILKTASAVVLGSIKKKKKVGNEN